MSGKTKLIIKAKDGRIVEKYFGTYEECADWISKNSEKYGIKYELTHAIFDQEPTIEIYQEKKDG